MTKYCLSDRAKTDLADIWGYAFQFERSEARADKWVDRIYDIFEALAETPAMGRGRDWLEPGQLAFSSGRYLIVYERTSDGIEVARVSGADGSLRRG